MIKKHEAKYNRYISALKRGRQSLYQHYTRYSDKKARAWQAIAKRCSDENGMGLTVVGGVNTYTFSTGYVKRVEGGAVLVYDFVGGMDIIPLSVEQRQEVSRLLCLTV